MLSIRRFSAFALLAFFFAAPGPAAAGKPAPISDLKPTVILISLDGFANRYLSRGLSPTLLHLARTGVRAKDGMIPSFPTKTFPNHYSIVTGLYPAHHGIVANNILDKDIPGQFKLSDEKQVEDPRWWWGEPVWQTAEKQGQRTASMFWPGGGTPINGSHPTYYKPFDKKVTAEARVQQILDWLDLPAGERPTFLALYIQNTDDMGHKFGPDSAQLNQAIRRVDAAIGLLWNGLKARGIDGQVDIVIVSDHGMAYTPKSKVILLDKYVDPKYLDVLEWSPLIALAIKPEAPANTWQKLQAVPHIKVYKKEDLPARWHYCCTDRIRPIIGVADEGWTLTTRAKFLKSVRENKYDLGNHGFDNNLESMRETFIAHGPGLIAGKTVRSFENVNVYSLLCRLLGIEPAKNDGSLEPFQSVLGEQAKAVGK